MFNLGSGDRRRRAAAGLSALLALTAGGLVLGGCDDEGPSAATDGGAVAVDAGSLDAAAADGLPQDAGDASTPVADGGPTDGAAEAGPLGSFETVPCKFTLPPGIWLAPRCGKVQVPEDRARPEGRRVVLAVAVLSLPGEKKPDPLVFLEGGPGGHAIDTVVDLSESFALLLANSSRSLVVFDQRGTGQSLPRLNCPESDAVNRKILIQGPAMVDEKDFSDSYAACRTRLTPQAGLEHYGTGQNAADVEAVRVALGYPPWNLLGSSYGTRLALEVMRSHPQGVRSVILDGVAPPGVNWVAEVPSAFDRTLRELSAACSRHPSCGRAYGDPARKLLDLAHKIDVTPLPLTLSNGSPVSLRGGPLLGITRLLMYDAGTLAVVPEFVQQIVDGNTGALAMIFEAILGIFELIDDGMHKSVICPEVLPLPVSAELTAAMAALDPLVRQTFGSRDSELACAQWGLAPAAPALVAPVTSAIPTLLLSGHFDPATPPAYAEKAAATLSKSWSFVVPHGSHGSSSDACGRSVVDAFLANPEVRPTLPCAAAMPLVDFQVPPTRLPAAARGQVPSGGDRGPDLRRDPGLRRALERLRAGFAARGPGRRTSF